MLQSTATAIFLRFRSTPLLDGGYGVHHIRHQRVFDGHQQILGFGSGVLPEFRRTGRDAMFQRFLQPAQILVPSFISASNASVQSPHADRLPLAQRPIPAMVQGYGHGGKFRSLVQAPSSLAFATPPRILLVYSIVYLTYTM